MAKFKVQCAMMMAHDLGTPFAGSPSLHQLLTLVTALLSPPWVWHWASCRISCCSHKVQSGERVQALKQVQRVLYRALVAMDHLPCHCP